VSKNQTCSWEQFVKTNMRFISVMPFGFQTTVVSTFAPKNNFIKKESIKTRAAFM
jgi:hypothetical protein